MSWEPKAADLRQHFLELEEVLNRVDRSSNHYEVLGVNRTAVTDEIKLAQRRTMTILSPADSRHGSLSVDFSRRISTTIRHVVKAFVVLGNYGSRVEYDNSLIRRAPVPLPMNLGTPISQKPASRLVVEASGQQHRPIDTAPAPSSESAAVNAYLYVAENFPESRIGGGQERIAISHSSAHALYTKAAAECKKDADKRKYQRLRLAIPTYVVGYNRTAGKWTEVAHTQDVSIGGVSLQLAMDMPEGAVVHLTFPMPAKLRRHGYSEPTYQVYAIVRRVQQQDEKRHVVGVEFLGASPPPGYLKKPWARFQTKW